MARHGRRPLPSLRSLYTLTLAVLAAHGVYGQRTRPHRRRHHDAPYLPCSNSCLSASDGICDDGSSASLRRPARVKCELGTDCADCGHTGLTPQSPAPLADVLTLVPETAPPPPPPSEPPLQVLRKRGISVFAARTATQPSFTMPCAVSCFARSSHLPVFVRDGHRRCPGGSVRASQSKTPNSNGIQVHFRHPRYRCLGRHGSQSRRRAALQSLLAAADRELLCQGRTCPGRRRKLWILLAFCCETWLPRPRI